MKDVLRASFENQGIGGIEQAAGQMRRITLTENLLRRREQLTSELNRVNEVIRILEANPQVQEVMDALAKLGI